MKESHREGVANHSDSESCGTHREVRREALTWHRQAGWVLSFESNDRERRRCQVKRKAKRKASKTRDAGRLPGVGDPKHAGNPLHGSQEIPVAHAALRKRALKIERKLLYTWKHQFEGRPEPRHANLAKTPEERKDKQLREEIAKLKAALADKTLENDFFQKCLLRIKEGR